MKRTADPRRPARSDARLRVPDVDPRQDHCADDRYVVLWDKTEADLVSIEYKAPKRIVKIEKKPEGYWWGSDITIETRPKAKPANEGSGAGSGSSAAGAGSGSAGAGSGSAAKPAEPEEEEVSRKTHEFPLGDGGDKMIKDYTAARALRDLGVPNDEAKKDYKLVDAKTTITVTFKDGPKTFLVGGSVYGGSDRYVVDQSNGHAYVFSRDLISGLEIGESGLHLLDPRGFDAAKIDQVTIEAGGKTKTVTRVEAEQEGTKRKTWGDADTKAPNVLAANFVDGINNLRPMEYDAKLKASDMQQVLKLTYKSDKGAVLGTLVLLRYEQPGELAPGQELDPANPPKGDTEYYIMTEKTRVPGKVRKDTAQRTENDIENVFSGKAPEGTGSGAGSAHSVDPHGNPFGGHGAMPSGLKPGSGSATMPAPHGAAPAMGSAAAAPGTSAHPAGSAAAPGAKPVAPASTAAAKPAPSAPAAPHPAAPHPAVPAPAAPHPATPAAAAPHPATPAPAAPVGATGSATH